MTTQGMKETEAEEVARLIARALHNHAAEAALGEVKARAAELAAGFPPYPADFSGHV
jgi:glycine/serine hydroxymethyltransferase